MHCCPSMPPVPCPPPCPATQSSKHDGSSKYFREIGTAVIGNQLIIRMEREKGKSKRTSEWDPPCDCEVVEIQRPTSKEGPKILKGTGNNQILFRVQSKSHLSKSDNDNSAQAISYEVARCKGGPNTNDQCRTFTIYPVLDASGTQEVHTDRVTEGNENVFMLRVKKKPQSIEEPKRNIELELRTPRPPTPPPVQPVRQQVMDRTTIASICNGEKQTPPEENAKNEATPKKKNKKKKKRR